MKIGYLISNYLPRIGGAEAFVHNMATELTKRGHDVIVVTPSRGRKFDKSFGYKIVRLNPLLMRLLFINFRLTKSYVERLLANLQRKYGFDIWQATIGYPLGAAAVDFFSKNGIPCVLRCVGEDIQVHPEIRYGYRLNSKADNIIREQYKKFTAVIAASESMKNDFVSIGVPAEKISIIPNGIDCAKFKNVADREKIRKSLGVGDNQKLLLTVGRNHPKKGFDRIIPVAKILSRRHTGFKWLLIGKDCDKIKADAKAAGLGDYFISKEIKAVISPSGELEVPSRELIRYYQAADIFVFPTYIELFAKVMIEAFAAGLAIVTTDAPGVNEMIESGVNGLKAKRGDADEMASLLIRIFDDKDLERRLKDNALSAAQGYDWSTVVGRYVDLYKKISHGARRARVVHVITDLDIGGAELMLLKILRNSDMNLYDHLVISLKPKGKVAKGIEAAGIRVVSLNMKWYNFPLSLGRLYRIFKTEKPDIVHNYLFHAELAGRICGRMAGVPVVISSLRSVDVGSDFRRLLLRLTDNLADAVTAVSEKVAYEHVNKNITKKEKVKVIYNGLEPARVERKAGKDEIRRRHGILPAEYLVLSVGNLRPVKGYSFVFDAVKMLKERGRDVKLLIVGGGNYRRNLEAEAMDKGIRDKIVFSGEREDVSDFLSMADAFVMASLWEGLPNSLLEAMQAGLPVIATKVGGIPEVVRHNENGLLVDPKDGRALADAIESMIKDEALGRRLAQSAKSYVEEKFDIRKTVAETEKLYEGLLRPFGARNDR
ncbi:MAG: glycosyltransferase [Candidatus Omnitrophota bacterium]|nr:glycosyltransferase [Candidatus Omnitrophota bacterium]